MKLIVVQECLLPTITVESRTSQRLPIYAAKSAKFFKKIDVKLNYD